MVKSSDNLVLRRINIVKWRSPVAQQYRVGSVPHFMLYDESGRLVKQGFEVYRDILAWNRKKRR